LLLALVGWREQAADRMVLLVALQLLVEAEQFCYQAVVEQVVSTTAFQVAAQVAVQQELVGVLAAEVVKVTGQQGAAVPQDILAMAAMLRAPTGRVAMQALPVQVVAEVQVVQEIPLV
jgi:hypothetical protein